MMFLPVLQRLSMWPSHPDYHPSYTRVGVRIDGVERTDIQWYSIGEGLARVVGTNQLLTGEIEAYWRFEESRQQRRARESWERKKGYVWNGMGSGNVS